MPEGIIAQQITQGDICELKMDGSISRVIVPSYKDEPWLLSLQALGKNRLLYITHDSLCAIDIDGSNRVCIRSRTDTTSALSGSPGISRDGEKVAYMAKVPTSPNATDSTFYLYVVDSRDPSRVIATAHVDMLVVNRVAFSPDGRQMYCLAYDRDTTIKLMVISADGTGLRSLGTSSTVTPSWSPDGTRIALTEGDSGTISICDVASGNRKTFTLGGIDGVVDLVWSPDGSKLAYCQEVYKNSQAFNETWIIDMNGNYSVAAITPLRTGPSQWFPDGTKILVTGYLPTKLVQQTGILDVQTKNVDWIATDLWPVMLIP